MTSWTAPQVKRTEPPSIAGEREMLETWLDYHRQTLLTKCAGLTAEQLKEHSVPASALTLLGMVRHMAEVERSWFRRRLSGEDTGWIYCSDDNLDGDFDDVAGADPAADFATLAREVELAKTAAAGRSLDDTFFHSRAQVEMSLRWVYVHMIEEYARHNGHADLIRESIDGAAGD
jgi:uncharacterized damage-inducible protein DinB